MLKAGMELSQMKERNMVCVPVLVGFGVELGVGVCGTDSDLGFREKGEQELSFI